MTSAAVHSRTSLSLFTTVLDSLLHSTSPLPMSNPAPSSKSYGANGGSSPLPVGNCLQQGAMMCLSTGLSAQFHPLGLSILVHTTLAYVSNLFVICLFASYCSMYCTTTTWLLSSPTPHLSSDVTSTKPS